MNSTTCNASDTYSEYSSILAGSILARCSGIISKQLFSRTCRLSEIYAIPNRKCLLEASKQTEPFYYCYYLVLHTIFPFASILQAIDISYHRLRVFCYSDTLKYTGTWQKPLCFWSYQQRALHKHSAKRAIALPKFCEGKSVRFFLFRLLRLFRLFRLFCFRLILALECRVVIEEKLKNISQMQIACS